jgi:hypothetical protein
MYRSAETSVSTNSVGSAGRCRAAFKASSRSHSATVFPALWAAVSTSANSSGVTLVAMVLARKTGRASSFWEAGDCNGAGMREVLMRNPPRNQIAPCDFRRQAPECWKPLAISAFTRLGSGVLWVFTRVNTSPTMRKLQTSKLLIQSAFTFG